MEKTAGSQVYGCSELLLYFLWAKFDSCTFTREMAKPFPMHPGIERRGGTTFSWWNLVWLSDIDAWDDTQRGCHIRCELAHE